MKAIPEYPGYFVTEDGEVYSNRRGSIKQRKPYANKAGYLCITMRTEDNVTHQWYIHALVLHTFAGERPAGQECRHLDGNKLNNNISNLAYGTHKENNRDKIDHGTIHKGEKHHLTTLTEADVKDIRWMLEQNRFTQAVIGEMFGVSGRSVSAIKLKKTWAHLT